MTLAAILMFSVVCASPAQSSVEAGGQTAPQAASVTKPDSAAPQEQTSPAPAPSTAPSQTPAQESTGQVPSKQVPTKQGPSKTAPGNHHRKRVLPPNCNPAPAATGQAGSAPATSDPPATKSAPTPCPPPKIIVRQGGTSEPSIQLAGGPATDQTTQTRDTAHQLLGTTQANLKKISGRQLTASQQDMVNQIHQYMDQSKKAVDDGDLDRARTLAWKAQLLSEELVKPEK